jgi:hypothetical protein
MSMWKSRFPWWWEGRVMVDVARENQADRPDRQHATVRRQVPAGVRAGAIRADWQGAHRAGGIAGGEFQRRTGPDSEPPAELDYDLWLGPAPWRPYNKNHVHYNFRFFWDYSGGQMTNWGAHHLDIAQWGLGMDESGPVEVEATAKFDPQKRYEVPSESLVTYRYANGVTVYCDQGPDRKMGTTFEGDKGTIYVNRGKLESDPADIITTPLGANDVRLYVSKNHIDNWYECIKSRKLPICDVEIGHRSATVCHLGSLAMRTGAS